jgi:hypothetical protein
MLAGIIDYQRPLTDPHDPIAETTDEDQQDVKDLFVCSYYLFS